MTERAVGALQNHRRIGASKIVAVDEIAEIDVLTDERIEHLPGRAVGDRGVEVLELAVLDIGSKEGIPGDRAADADGVLVNRWGSKLARDLCRDARGAATGQE